MGCVVCLHLNDGSLHSWCSFFGMKSPLVLTDTLVSCTEIPSNALDSTRLWWRCASLKGLNPKPLTHHHELIMFDVRLKSLSEFLSTLSKPLLLSTVCIFPSSFLPFDLQNGVYSQGEPCSSAPAVHETNAIYSNGRTAPSVSGTSAEWVCPSRT